MGDERLNRDYPSLPQEADFSGTLNADSAVFTLWHIQEIDKLTENVTLLGCFSSEELAKKSAEICSGLERFSDGKGTFEVSEACLDSVGWLEGFKTIWS